MLRLLRHLKPYQNMIWVALTLVFVQSMSELYLPTLMAQIVDVGVPTGNIPYILKTGLRMLLVTIIGMASSISAGYLSSRVSAGFGKDLRDGVFSKVESFSLKEFHELGTASLITRTTNDITQVQMGVLMSLRMIASAPIMAIGGIIMAVSMDPGLSVTLLWVLPVLGIMMTVAVIKGMPIFTAIQKKIDRLNLILRENLTGMRVVRAFNREEHEAERFDAASRDLVDINLRVHRIVAVMMPLIMLTINFTTIALIWFGGKRIDAGNLEVGGLMAFVQYAMRILFSLLNISFIFIMYPRAAASIDRINEVLESETEIKDPNNPLKSISSLAGVEFQNVTFSYPGAESPALKDVSFEAKPGETTAIIGGTGSGKSTLVNLVPRFYDVDFGRILVGGVDVRQMTQKELRSKIGLVPQRAVLFSGTIAENIRYGKEDATDDEVAHAADVAEAQKFIESLPEGFNAEVAQGGSNFSGGQKQRLAIARAIVRKPPVYIFDDSFSALDFRTDANLRSALSKETGGATVIIVAQRVSTIMNADKILVLDKGRIVGQGTHKQLLNSNDVYREIVLSQMSEEDIA